MKFIESLLKGVFIIEQDVHKDTRGAFVKNFQREEFQHWGLECDFRESYYTRSKEDVIRGMHFQAPPHDHGKLVTVIQGTIVDVILDLRKSSPTFKQFIAIELPRENRRSIYIPRGCAHGFGVLSDTAIAFYMTTTQYAPEHDRGVRHDSFGYDWGINQPIMSERDKSLTVLGEFTDFLE